MKEFNVAEEYPPGDLDKEVTRIYETKNFRELAELSVEIFTRFSWGKVEKAALGQAYKYREKELENVKRD